MQLNVDSTACVPVIGKGWVDDTYTAVGDCDLSCESCFMAGDPSKCLTCAGSSTALYPLETNMGECKCKPGYVPDTEPTCTLCAGSCPYCIGPEPSHCTTLEEANFVATMSRLYGSELPYTEETDSMFCYRTSRPSTRCGSGNVFESVIGTIDDYSTLGSAAPTKVQCQTLLTATWPHVVYSFSELFPGFTGPEGVGYNDILTIKTILQVWILQFGYFESLDGGYHCHDCGRKLEWV